MTTISKNPKLDKLSQSIYIPPYSEKYRVFKEKLSSLEFGQLLTKDLIRKIPDFLYRPSARPLMKRTLDSYEF